MSVDGGGGGCSGAIELKSTERSLTDLASIVKRPQQLRHRGLRTPLARMFASKWERDASDSELSDSEHFLTRGAFLLTPSHDLSMDKAAGICEKMNFKGYFSLTKTATGILFKFSDHDDYQAVYKKGFHRVTNARFYKKVAIPCRPQKTFTVFVLEIPEEVPEEDIRHALYKFNSIVEVCRMPKTGGHPPAHPLSPALAKAHAPAHGHESSAGSEKGVPATQSGGGGGAVEASSIRGASATLHHHHIYHHGLAEYSGPPLVRVTLASLDEANSLLQNGLDFYGATYFPTEGPLTAAVAAAPYLNAASMRKALVGNRSAPTPSSH